MVSSSHGVRWPTCSRSPGPAVAHLMLVRYGGQDADDALTADPIHLNERLGRGAPGSYSSPASSRRKVGMSIG